MKLFPASLLTNKGRYLLLDRIQDPGNMGTIIRTACSFGIEGIILMKGTVDPYSPKAARAAMSALDKVSITKIDSLTELAGYQLIAADTSGVDLRSFHWPDNFILAVGNEANGLCEEITRSAESIVSIPVSGNIESLNAAIACAIVLFESQK